ncbi:MAG: MarR family transcriptional regulator [Clostridiales bacterium]|nr:MarR family transcriptional regulator [Clostridiales bacterium]
MIEVMNIEEKLYQYLRRIAHLMRHHADVKGGQGRILGILLQQERMTQREMQEELGVQAGSLSEILAKLEAGGLITRMPNEEDRRSVDIVLREEGSRVAKESETKRKKRQKILFQALSGEEKENLAALLEKLYVDWQESYEKGKISCCHGFGRWGHVCHEGHDHHEEVQP